MLYKSLVVPLMDYRDTVYMQPNQQNLQKLQTIQNKHVEQFYKQVPENIIQKCIVNRNLMY